MQSFPSLQFSGTWTGQTPWLHVVAGRNRPPSHLAAEHWAVLLACIQPVGATHESVVHAFPSSQSTESPPVQTPAAQVIRAVQVFPEHEPALHSLPSGTALQELAAVLGSQAWQELDGFGAPPARQDPAIRQAPA